MNPKVFRRQAMSIYWLARLRRALRMSLRAAWAGGAGYLLAWGSSIIWDFFPRQSDWFLVGFVFAFLNLLFIFFRIGTIDQFMWRLDRHFEMKEQYITAWQVSKQKEVQEVEGLLLADMTARTPHVWGRVLRQTGKLKREVGALTIVLLLFLIIYLIGLINFPQLPGFGFGNLPGLGGEGSFESVFPSGVPGDTGAQNDDPSEGDGEGPAEMNPEELGDTGEALEDLGENLQEHGATGELGEELAENDFDDAADEMEELSEQVEELSEETKDEIAQDLRDAADQLDQPGQEYLADDLREAAEALENDDSQTASQALDDLAEDLRDLADQAGNGNGQQDESVGANQGDTSESESFERIDDEGETISLDDLEEGEAGLLQPGGEGGEGVLVDGETSVEGTGVGEEGTGELTPLDIPWTEQDVVKEYFTP